MRHLSNDLLEPKRCFAGSAAGSSIVIVNRNDDPERFKW
jgi:hypothetical protein